MFEKGGTGVCNWHKCEKKYSIPDSHLRTQISYDLIIGVGIGVDRSGIGPSPMSHAVAEKCLKLYQLGYSKYVMLVSTNGINGLTEASAMASVIRDRLPEKALIVSADGNDRNTRANALTAKQLAELSSLPGDNIIVVAQQWHARRVAGVFRKVFKKVSIIKAWSEYGAAHQRRLSSALAFHVWEWIATRVFRLKGWL